jgi:hypothetical protein
MAGLLTYYSLYTFPFLKQWYSYKGRQYSVEVVYSSGDCPGFTPDSLLILSQERNRKAMQRYEFVLIAKMNIAAG